MAEVSLQFKDKTLSKFLLSTQKKHKAIREFKKDYVVFIAANVFQDIDDHFLRSQGPKQKWDKWSTAYNNWLAKNRPSRLGGKVLMDYGKLRKGLIPIRRGGNWRKAGKGIMWFNPVSYARVHDEGGRSVFNKRNIKLPARPFMWLSDKGMTRIESDTVKFLQTIGS